MRAYISGATLLLVGILIGVLIGPTVRDTDTDTASASATGGAASAAPTAGASPTGGPSPSPSAALPSVALPSVAPTPSTTSSNPGPENTVDPAQPVVVGLGDSITYNANSWFRQLCAAESVIRNCVNAGVRGNTTAQMLARLEPVLTYQPAVVIVMGGTNDLKKRLSAKAITRHLDIILDRAKQSGASVVLCTIPPRNHYGRQVLVLNAAIRAYAARGEIPLMDLYDSVGTAKGVYRPGMTEDGIHPNRRAADLMTVAAGQQLPELLFAGSGSPLPSGVSSR